MSRFDRYLSGDPAIPQDGPPKPTDPQGPSEFERGLEELINKHSMENGSGTPDFILAEYLNACLTTYNNTIRARAAWRGESIELPSLQQIEQGKRTVPMAVSSPNGRMMNDIGEAEIKITPGEMALPVGRIERVIAVFEDDER